VAAGDFNRLVQFSGQVDTRIAIAWLLNLQKKPQSGKLGGGEGGGEGGISALVPISPKTAKCQNAPEKWHFIPDSGSYQKSNHTLYSG
jgi:hypothetical protein